MAIHYLHKTSVGVYAHHKRTTKLVFKISNSGEGPIHKIDPQLANPQSTETEGIPLREARLYLQQLLFVATTAA